MTNNHNQNPDSVFIGRREKYAEDFSKTVTPFTDISMRFLTFGVEYGKTTVSYLFLINTGGLAGILALYPLVREINQVWLFQAMLPAALFGIGLALATVSAALAYLNFNYNSKIYFARALDDDNWLKHWHFNMHR